MRCRAILAGLVVVVLPLSAASAQEPGKSDAADKLRKAQLVAAQKCYRAGLGTMETRVVEGLLVLARGNQRARPDLAYVWSVRWLHAQRDLAKTKEERIAAFVAHEKRMKDVRQQTITLVGDGSGGLLAASEAPAADWYVAEAELWLLQEREK
jgi:hypothetical protein